MIMLEVNVESLSRIIENHFIIKNEKEVIINLPISIDSKFYNNKEILKLFFELILDYVNNGIKYKDKKTKKEISLKIAEVQLDLGCTLNRHNIYFWDINKYMLKHKINNYNEVPINIKLKYEEESYRKSDEQGVKWLKSNIDIFNILIPESSKLTKDYIPTKSKENLYKGHKNFPKITCIRYSYWLNHEKYQKISSALEGACTLENSKIQKVFEVEAKHFYRKLENNKTIRIANKEFFVNNAIKYLKDEAVAFIILYNDNHNVIEFYLGWENQFSLAFRGKKMRKDIEAQKYLQGSLKGADQRKFVPIKILDD